jgi:hypothetical protein
MPAGIINRFVILSINRKAVSRRCGFSPAASATAWSKILDLLLQHFEQTQQVGATQDGPMLRYFLKGRMRAV